MNMSSMSINPSNNGLIENFPRMNFSSLSECWGPVRADNEEPGWLGPGAASLYNTLTQLATSSSERKVDAVLQTAMWSQCRTSLDSGKLHSLHSFNIQDLVIS